MQITKKTIPLNHIYREENVRRQSRESDPLSIRALADNILAEGLKTPLRVTQTGDDRYVILKGHRRSRALAMIEETDSSAYREYFAKGIPCEVCIGTPEELALEHVDHGTIETLDRVEVLLAFRYLYRRGISVDRCAVQLAGLLNNYQSISENKKKELQAEADEAYAKCGGDANPMGKQIAQKAWDAAYAKYRRGLLQNMQAVLDCPPIILAAYIMQQSGIIGDAQIEGDFTEAALTAIPKITFARAATLRKALANDMSASPKYHRTNPGPQFAAALAEMNKEPKEGEAKAKALTGKEMEVEQGKYQSAAFRALIALLRGVPYATFDLAASDLMMSRLEAVAESKSEGDSDLLDQILVRGGELIEAAATAAVAEPVAS